MGPGRRIWALNTSMRRRQGPAGLKRGNGAIRARVGVTIATVLRKIGWGAIRARVG